MSSIDLEFVRSQFPAFSEPCLKGFAQLENAGGSWVCGQVIDRMTKFWRQSRLQPYYPSAPSMEGGAVMDDSKTRMAAWLGVETDEVHFGPSTTANTYVLGQALRSTLQPGDEMIVTNQDHEANIGAWQRLADSGVVIREWRVNPETAELETEGLAALLSERTRAVALTHCSNIVGSINPLTKWCGMIRDAGALSIVDGVSYAPHGLADLGALGADIYLFSLYKVYGPHLGVMYMHRGWNERLPHQGHYFNEKKAAYRFTPAGPDHGQTGAAGGVIDYFEAVDVHHFPDATNGRPGQRVQDLFREQEQAVTQPLLDFVSAHPCLKLIGSQVAENRAPTVSFTVKGKTPEDLAIELAGKNLGVGFGDFYATRLMDALSIPLETGVLRCSFVHYTSEDEVTRLIESLDYLL